MSLHTQKLKKIIKNSILPILSFTLFSGTVFFWNSQNYGLALECNGKPIATVPNGKICEEAKHKVMEQLTPSKKSKVEDKYSQKIVPLNNSAYCESPSEIKDKIIENSQDVVIEACGIYVDDKLIGVGESKETIQKMFDEATEEQKKSNPDKEISIIENIEFKPGLFAPEDVKSISELKKYLFNETEKEFKYITLEGESVSSIAEKFDVSEESIRERNDIAENEVMPNDVLIITLKESVLHFEFSKTIEEESEIPFETEERANDSKLKSWSKVIQEGVNGKETYTYEVKYDASGRELGRIELGHEVISEPVTRIIEKGTKEEPEGFLWPVPYTRNITSPFGPRWGTIHKGIDIASAGVLGTDIVAAESGTVVKASHGSTGYGNHIIIQHAGVYSTLYGHCQQLCVSVGDKVAKGQVIGKVGSTGDSTGPHLHFEIRVNGKQEDPQKYL